MAPDEKTEITVDPDAEATDLRLAAQACRGDAEALETLLRRHQGWIYNIALRMLQTREDAEDATQEVMLKIATHLSGFRGESGFRTWAYRIMANHVLDRRRSRPEQLVHDFTCYGDYLENAPSEALPPEFGSEQERALLIAEARRGCLLGMLLCLDRRQRLAFILGEIFEETVAAGNRLLYREHPFYQPNDLAGRLRRLIADEAFRTRFDLPFTGA